MAISRKPKTQASGDGAVDVEALIAKGGSVAQLAETNGPAGAPLETEKGTAAFTLRMPGELLQALDQHRRTQPYKVPRQQWILEAIVQRLEREILKPKEE